MRVHALDDGCCGAIEWGSASISRYCLACSCPAFLLVVVVWRGSRAYLPPVRRYAVLVLRLLAVSLLILAVSGPTLRLNTNDLAVAVLLDRSASITPAERAQEEDWVARAPAAKEQAMVDGPDDQLGHQVDVGLGSDLHALYAARGTSVRTSSTRRCPRR